FLWILLLCSLQPKTSSKTSLRGPHQIQTLIILRSLLRIVIELSSVLVLSLFQQHISQTCSCSRPKSSDLAQLCHTSQTASRSLERLFKMFSRILKVVARVRQTAHTQFIARKNYGVAIFVQLLFCFESYGNSTGGRGNTYILSLDRANNRADSK